MKNCLPVGARPTGNTMLATDVLLAIVVVLMSSALAFVALWVFSVVSTPVQAPPQDTPENELSDQEALSNFEPTAADIAPVPLWSEDSDNQITWANDAYLALIAANRSEDCFSWPPPRAFDTDLLGAENKARLTHETNDETPVRSFSVVRQVAFDKTHFAAIPADDVVAAERALQTFVQTLTKTFAMLPTGLSIFDRDRRLALFNPALTDLTTLPVAFLSARPTLYDFLDKLREKQMMPEPKDYRSFRQQLVDLEAAATDGTYEENWTLPTGQTYQVTGRPHPDGAVAFLFQDISAEISLTRRFRSELELGQTVIDSLPVAISVFSHSGTLALSNQSFDSLWEMSPSTALGEIHITEATRRWSELCMPSPIWGDLRSFVLGVEDRAEWSGDVKLQSGKHLICRVVPLHGNATLISFSDFSQAPSAPSDMAKATVA